MKVALATFIFCLRYIRPSIVLLHQTEPGGFDRQVLITAPICPVN